MHYMETVLKLKAGTPTKAVLVGLAFVFAPAFQGEDTEEPIGGVTFHEAARIAEQRRSQRIRREKAAARETKLAEQAAEAACLPPQQQPVAAGKSKRE